MPATSAADTRRCDGQLRSRGHVRALHPSPLPCVLFSRTAFAPCLLNRVLPGGCRSSWIHFLPQPSSADSPDLWGRGGGRPVFTEVSRFQTQPSPDTAMLNVTHTEPAPRPGGPAVPPTRADLRSVMWAFCPERCIYFLTVHKDVPKSGQEATPRAVVPLPRNAFVGRHVHSEPSP